MLGEPNPDLLPQVQQSEEFLPPISLWTTLGGVFIVGTVGVAVTLAAVIKYNVTVKAPAIVRPMGELRIVQAATAGTVKSIKVKENQVVKQGDAIATIDNSQLLLKKSQLEGNIKQNQQQLAQIAAQISTLDSQRESQSNFIDRTIASAQAQLELSQRDYKDKQITTKTKVLEAQAALDLAKEELKRYQRLANTGAIATLQVKEKEQAFIAAQARLKGAQAGLNPSAAPVAIATEQIARERARGLATLATLNKEREQLQSTRTEIQNQVGNNVKELQRIEIELGKTAIVAPTDGTILKLELRNFGQVVSPGTSIAQIAPADAKVVVMARVAAQDISNVKSCKEAKVEECKDGKVQLRFSAYPYPDYGVLKGAVRAIAPDATTPQSGSAGAVAPSYEVTIEPETPNFVRGDHSYPILPGMEATADIISKEDTVLTFMLRKARLITDL